MRTVRTVVAFLVACLVFIAYISFSAWLLGRMADNSSTRMISFILGSGMAAFLSVAVACMVSPKEHRHILIGFLVYALCALYISEFFPLPKEFWPFAGDVIQLSFASLGAYGAAALLGNLGKARFPRRTGAGATRLPFILIVLAMVSIPITYVMLFLSFLVALGISGWLMMILLQLERVPLVIIIGVGLAPLFSGIAAVRGLIVAFRRPVSAVPALSVPKELSGSLDRVVTEVCEAVGAAYPDHVILHAEPTFFVTQTRAITLDEQTHKGRILAIGAPLLYSLGTGELKSILAHEFAHFTGRDTNYSRTVLPVYRSISSALQALQGVGGGSTVSVIINVLQMVPRLCIITFIRYFAAIDSLLGRRREMRADHIAVAAFGDEPFRRGLLETVRVMRFWSKNLESFQPKGDFFLYLRDRMVASQAEADALLAVEQSKEEDVFDSHPTLSTRLDDLEHVDKAHGVHPTMEEIRAELAELLAGLSSRFIKLYKDAMGSNESE